jgi:MoxR-like ATPase
MEEGQVTVDGVSHPIPQPFYVVATQNPTGTAGTQLLPDSQMDRFMMRLSLGYLTHDDEGLLLKRKEGLSLMDQVKPVLNGQDLELMCAEVEEVYVSQEIYEYIVSLVVATRNHPDILQGASPRASIALVRLSKASAYLQGRDFVIPKDITPILSDAVSHRLILRPGAEQERITATKVLDDIQHSIKEPKIG